jgi:hypothetical protein
LAADLVDDLGRQRRAVPKLDLQLAL